MKQVILIIVSIGFLCACSKEVKKQTNWVKDSTEIAKLRNYINNPKNATSIEWLDSMYVELDTIKQGNLINLSWRFKNIGKKPLIIANASSGCQCTVLEKPKKPIEPGKLGVIKATFDSKDMLGWQRKDVYLLLNDKSNLVQTLSFAVKVIK